MSQIDEKQQSPAISREFAARLDRLGAKQTVRAIVMLQTGENSATGSRRPTRQRRAETLEQIRQASRAALPDIDRILERYHGQRLSEDVDALGSITVETTAEGIRALAASEHVKAIFEDQSIFQLPHSKS
jgi:lysophospholipase L1-like esterase